MDRYGPPIPPTCFPPAAVRAVAGAVAAALLLLAVPTPAAAAPTPKVTITDVTVTEGTGAAVNASFTIQVAPRPDRLLCAPSQLGDGTGFRDRTRRLHGLLRDRLPHEDATSRVVSVPVTGDAIDEPNETFVVNLTNLVGSPGSIVDAQGVGTITDNDAPPLLSVNDVSVTEGTPAPRRRRSPLPSRPRAANAVTFNWATAAGTATAGVDYVAASGSRTIAAGATTATIGITVNGDVLAEAQRDLHHHAVHPVERHDRRRLRARHHHRRRSAPRPFGQRRLGHGGQRRHDARRRSPSLSRPRAGTP